MLMLDSSHQQLGMLLLICFLVAKRGERRKNNQEPMSRNQEPLGHIRKDEDPEARNDQDPRRTSKEKIQDPVGTIKR